MTNLYERLNYITDRKLIMSTTIYEYDLSKANINMLRAYGKISEKEYENLKRLDKFNREREIGLKIIHESEYKCTDTYDTIKNGIIEAKRQFFLNNKLEDSSIIRIANDAVFVETNKPLIEKVNINGYDLSFKIDGVYRTMIQLGKIIIFIKHLPNDDYIDLNVIGISNEMLHLHELMLSFICDIIMNLERSDKMTVVYQYKQFYEDFINKRLEIGYYRELNADSSYRIINSPIGCGNLDEKYINMIDINYNLYILRELYKLILTS